MGQSFRSSGDRMRYPRPGGSWGDRPYPHLFPRRRPGLRLDSELRRNTKGERIGPPDALPSSGNPLPSQGLGQEEGRRSGPPGFGVSARSVPRLRVDRDLLLGFRRLASLGQMDGQQTVAEFRLAMLLVDSRRHRDLPLELAVEALRIAALFLLVLLLAPKREHTVVDRPFDVLVGPTRH